MITREQVDRIAQLARLALHDEERQRMTRELGAILQYVQCLNELDTTQVLPSPQVGDEASRVRDDVPGSGLERERVLGQSPGAEHDGFAVPGFVDD
jgi:aspartyl-tRNA(Asn)/glutamyl-tRNA(Gln) amidotransferase subunit C